ncbi:MAG: RcnB family protein [Alphaproteobacteria bacterium]|nr:RcnB family protein [Alphaproteobacteria bacterium]MBV9370984.1 RcnB family protein [Alphaproteobacteria bacterium]MBV9899527.1 RcnB family protein [Alphaproteobacteria bacterium]
MKIVSKFILGAAAASVVAAAPAAAAPFQGRDHDGRGRVEQVRTTRVVSRDAGRRVVQVRQVQARKWARGQRFDRRYAQNYRVIQNPRAYRLNAAPRGYRWVQSGNDAVLVAIASGIIGSVLANRF